MACLNPRTSPPSRLTRRRVSVVVARGTQRNPRSGLFPENIRELRMAWGPPDGWREALACGTWARPFSNRGLFLDFDLSIRDPSREPFGRRTLFGSSVKEVQESRPAGWKGYSGQGLLRSHSETLGSLVQHLWPLEFSETRHDELTDGRTETLC